MASRMNNGNLKIVNNTQTSADNADMGKIGFNHVQSAIIKRLRRFFLDRGKLIISNGQIKKLGFLRYQAFLMYEGMKKIY
ncbi:hypothetical protein SAMN05444673_4292 [Bacillus sp. OV166]|uniref:hypothetical protein n=1 Tax=Bacillus sp. OV166 TaxID=1882763 RepID=UPI000A2AB95C|nr:hypothetical protein [Bacillus sp. OV166]SMQ81398.1 hypothetical protein SAMN05444673_4292 [Bacillus sp. OV166]